MELLLIKDDIIFIAIIYYIFNPFKNPRPAMTYPGHLLDSAAWSMSCDEPLLSSIRHGITFQGPGQNFLSVITVKYYIYMERLGPSLGLIVSEKLVSEKQFVISI